MDFTAVMCKGLFDLHLLHISIPVLVVVVPVAGPAASYPPEGLAICIGAGWARGGFIFAPPFVPFTMLLLFLFNHLILPSVHIVWPVHQFPSSLRLILLVLNLSQMTFCDEGCSREVMIMMISLLYVRGNNSLVSRLKSLH